MSEGDARHLDLQCVVTLCVFHSAPGQSSGSLHPAVAISTSWLGEKLQEFDFPFDLIRSHALPGLRADASRTLTPCDIYCLDGLFESLALLWCRELHQQCACTLASLLHHPMLETPDSRSAGDC